MDKIRIRLEVSWFIKDVNPPTHPWQTRVVEIPTPHNGSLLLISAAIGPQHD